MDFKMYSAEWDQSIIVFAAVDEERPKKGLK